VAVVAEVLSEVQRRTLEAVCDTVVPAVQASDATGPMSDYLARAALTFLFFYALPDERGRNPNWEALGYPGPISAPPSPEDAPKTINTLSVEASSRR
jgi:hypothetical protein